MPLDKKLYRISRKVEKLDESRKQYKYTFEIPDIMWLLNNQTNRNICTKWKNAKKDGSVEEQPFQLMVKFVGYNCVCNELLQFYYKPLDSTYLRVWLSVMGEDKEFPNACIEKELSNRLYHLAHNKEWHYLATLFKSNLEPERKLYNGKLCLLFKFEVVHINFIKEMPLQCLPHSENEEINELQPFQETNSLANDLINILNTTPFDVIVKSLQEVEFPALKIILKRSVVFKAHFEYDTVEKTTNVVESPFDTDVVEELLIYLKTDKTPNIEVLSQKLLPAADFYQLDGLKRLCEKSLEKQLTIENAIEILEMANLYKALYLKNRTLEFIKDGRARDITKFESWKKLEADVLRSLYEYVVNF